MRLIWKNNSLKYLNFGKKKISGRNNTGKITRYHRGGGTKKNLRHVDYKRYIWNIFAVVLRLEYDPNRSALLALLGYSNGILSYIIAPENIFIGDRLMSRFESAVKIGDATYLKNISVGVKIHSIELYPNHGAQLIRSAGSFATIISKSNKFVLLKLKSGEIRRINSFSMGVIGVVSNFEFIFRNFLKAGYYRLKGWRPCVRGVAMNPIDHPHGGGQGKTSGGRPSVTPKGIITKGKPTRKKKNKNIVKKRD